MKRKTFLFVYGTLMRDSKSELGRPQRRRLAAESRYIAPASVEGWLYDLGTYPALNLVSKKEIVQQARTNVVTGEVIQLLVPRVSLPWLDLYEGIQEPDDTNGGLYVRTTAQVRLNNGKECSAKEITAKEVTAKEVTAKEVTAWLYASNDATRRGRLLPQGRWQHRFDRPLREINTARH